MPFNGSGTFNRLYSWAVDAASNVNISSSRMDAEMTGLAAGLSNCLTRDGQSPPTADLPFGGRLLRNIGAATAGGDALNRDTGDARYMLSGATSGTLGGVTFTGGGASGTAVSTFGAYTANGETLHGTGVSSGYSHQRAGQVGYHLFNGGGVCEWLVYQPAHTTGDDFRVGILVSGVITDALRISSGGAVSIAGTLSVVGAATAATPANGDNSNRLATTAFVVNSIAGAGYASLSSPVFTGTPIVPTAAAGTASTQIATTAFVDRLRDLSATGQTSNYTLALSDRGGTVDFNGTSLTCTIPANASVPFPVGTVIVVSNFSASPLSITCGDTLILSGTITGGTRTLGQNGEARLRKAGTTTWLISGSALT